MNAEINPARQKWMIVAFGFLALSLSFSARASLGLIMPVWQSELGWSSSFISSVGAFALITMAIIAPFTGRLADTKGPRFTICLGLFILALGCGVVSITSSKIIFAIAFGGLCAIGFGIMAIHVVSTAVVNAFERRPGLATGIATSGSTGGQFLIVPLIALLLTQLSWRWSFAAISLACLLLIPFVLHYMGDPKAREKSSTLDDRPSSNFINDLRFILTKPAFHFLFWSFLICGFTTTGVIETHLLPFAAFCGIPPLPSATAYGLLSAINLLGMIGAGWLTDRVNRPLLLAAIYLLRASTFLLLPSIADGGIEGLIMFAIFFGAVDYSTVPVTVSLVASHIGVRSMGLTMGLISAGHSIGGAMGAFFGGYIFDLSGTYEIVWISSLWLAVGAGVLVLFIMKIRPTKIPA